VCYGVVDDVIIETFRLRVYVYGSVNGKRVVIHSCQPADVHVW